MDFTEDQKKQVIVWYYEGRSLKGVCNVFRTTYGYEMSRHRIQRILHSFQRFGCIHSNCNECFPKPKVCKRGNYTTEAFEIMVCAAAELELSTRDIALELGSSQTTVNRILRRHGYGREKEFCDATEFNDKLLNIDKPLEGEVCWEKKKQIIQWYYNGNIPSEIVRLFADTHKQDIPSKAWICHIIKLFKNQGCIRDCEKCIGVILEPSNIAEDSNLENALIAEMHKVELDEEKESEANLIPAHGNEKLEMNKLPLETCTIQNTDANCTLFNTTIKVEDTCIDNNTYERIHPPHQKDIEFVVVKPTMDVFVADEMNSSKQKKRKLS